MELTNEQIRMMTIRAAQNITKLGLAKGDVIGIVASNHHQLAPIVFAAMAIGCPINPLDPSFVCGEISHMFGITQPKLVFCNRDKIDVVRESLDSLNITAPIFTFDGPTLNSRAVDDLLVATHEEHQFV